MTAVGSVPEFRRIGGRRTEMRWLTGPEARQTDGLCEDLIVRAAAVTPDAVFAAMDPVALQAWRLGVIAGGRALLERIEQGEQE